MLQEWFSEKFAAPLCHYYTPEATLAYGLILCIMVYGAYMLLQRLKIKIDRNFLLAVLPFIIYGGWTRALRDHGLYQGWWWCSPPIYFIIFLVALGSLLAGLALQKKTGISYWKPMAAAGMALLAYDALLTSITNWFGFLFVLMLVCVWAALFFGLHRLFPARLSLENAGIIVSHLLDASSTFTALTFFGYYEQHVLPGFLIGMSGPWVMFPLKITVVLAVLLALDKYTEDRFFRNFLKIVVLILGLALGIRDWLTISMLGV